MTERADYFKIKQDELKVRYQELLKYGNWIIYEASIFVIWAGISYILGSVAAIATTDTALEINAIKLKDALKNQAAQNNHGGSSREKQERDAEENKCEKNSQSSIKEKGNEDIPQDAAQQAIKREKQIRELVPILKQEIQSLQDKMDWMKNTVFRSKDPPNGKGKEQEQLNEEKIDQEQQEKSQSSDKSGASKCKQQLLNSLSLQEQKLGRAAGWLVAVGGGFKATAGFLIIYGGWVLTCARRLALLHTLREKEKQKLEAELEVRTVQLEQQIQFLKEQIGYIEKILRGG